MASNIRGIHIRLKGVFSARELARPDFPAVSFGNIGKRRAQDRVDRAEDRIERTQTAAPGRPQYHRSFPVPLGSSFNPGQRQSLDHLINSASYFCKLFGDDVFASRSVQDGVSTEASTHNPSPCRVFGNDFRATNNGGTVSETAALPTSCRGSVKFRCNWF